MTAELFFGLLACACVVALVVGARDHTRRIQKLEEAVRELSPGLDI